MKSTLQIKTEPDPGAQAPPTRVKRTVGIVLYGFLFTVVVPLALFAWARAADPNVFLPSLRNVPLGTAVAVLGSLLLAIGLLSIVLYGQGLPMNPYPPPHYVSRGAYRLLRHPIYVGFSLLCAGLAVVSGSAGGLWLVSPVVMLSCAALVLGYENLDLQKRFGKPLPEPLLRLPSKTEQAPGIPDRLSIYFLVLFPWFVLYELLSFSGIPGNAASLYLPFERNLPVVEWTEGLYAGTYLLVVLVPWVARTKQVLRKFAIHGLVATFLMVLFFTTIPVNAPPRAFTPHTILGELLVLERRFDTSANAFPSYHAFWIMLATSVFAGRMPRWRYAWWLLGATMCLSCVTTGMHALVDVLAGVILFFAVKNTHTAWEFLRRSAECIANSWQEWQWGRVRIINHGLYAGVGAALAVASWSIAFLSLSGDQSRYLFRLPSMILPFEPNSVGAPYETPIICPAQPPRILSSRVARERWRGAAFWAPTNVDTSATHNVKAVNVNRIVRPSGWYVPGTIPFAMPVLLFCLVGAAHIDTPGTSEGSM